MQQANEGHNDAVLQRLANILKEQKHLEIFKLNGGSGGFGDVLFAKDMNTNEKYAVKCQVIFCAKLMQISDEKVSKCQQEFKILSECKHKNVVKVYGEYIIDNYHFIQMELCGPDLEQFTKINKDKALPLHIFLHFTNQLLDAVEHIHSLDIKLRDLTARNILICEDGTLKLCDFGLVKIHNNLLNYSKLHSLEPRGTPLYYPPELLEQLSEELTNLENKQKKRYEQTFQGDIWALGQCLSVLGGTEIKNLLSFNLDASVQSVNAPKLDQKCNDLIKFILNKDPLLRPSIKQIRQYIFENILNTTQLILRDQNIQLNEGSKIASQKQEHQVKKEDLSNQKPAVVIIPAAENVVEIKDDKAVEQNVDNGQIDGVEQQQFAKQWIDEVEKQRYQHRNHHQISTKLIGLLNFQKIKDLYEYLRKHFHLKNIIFLKKGSFIILYRAYSSQQQSDVTLKFANILDESYQDETAICNRLKGIKEVTQQYDYIELKDFGVSLTINENCSISLEDELIEKNYSLPEERKKKIIQEISLALQQVHNHDVVHMNVSLKHFVRSDTSSYKLSGFTQSLVSEKEEKTYSQSFVQPIILAPEMIKAIQTKQQLLISQNLDIFNLGVIVTSILGYGFDYNKINLFYREDFRDLINFANETNQLPIISKVIAKMLVREPAARIKSNEVFSVLYSI